MSNESFSERIFCPYRICPLGAHVDHQLGLISGFALNEGIELKYNPTEDGSFFVKSINFSGEIAYKVGEEIVKQFNWGDYLLGVITVLSEEYEIKRGFRGVVGSLLHSGGISSSAAVILSYLLAISKLNGIILTRPQLVKLAIKVEREFIGVNVGKLDQSCEVFCKKNNLLYMDMQNDNMELIPISPNMPDFSIAIIYSGVSRKLANSAYNLRVDECKAAAYALMAYSGMDYGKFEQARLRDVPRGVFEEYKHLLPENWRKRATHYYTELDRVKRGVEAFRRGELETFGECIKESGNSSIYQYEAGSEPLKALHSIMNETEGVYGGRFSGAGFNGCLMAIVEPDKQEEIRHTITQKYAEKFPEYINDFSIVFCETSDGIDI